MAKMVLVTSVSIINSYGLSVWSRLRHVSKSFLFIAVSIVLSACGGGGGGSDTAVGSDEVVSEKATISGSIFVGGNTVSDLDGPTSVGISNESNFGGLVASQKTDDLFVSLNDTFEEAQVIPNPSTVGGYISGVDRSAAHPADISDVFAVPLLEGQRIELNTFYSFPEDRSDGLPLEVEMSLLTITNTLDIRGGGTIQGEGTVVIEVEETGEYFIRLRASEGLSSPALYNLAIRNLSDSNPNPFLFLDFFPFEGGAEGEGESENEGEGESENEGETEGEAEGETEAEGEAETEVESDSSSDAVFNTLVETAVINDVRYTEQWNLRQVGARNAWIRSTGAGTVVAVLSSGIHPTHEDLDEQLLLDGFDDGDLILDGYDFVSTGDNEGDLQPGRDENPVDTGLSFLGSHSAGVIAAEPNGIGIRGLAFGAKILPVRVIGNDNNFIDEDLAEGILYAAGLPNASGKIPSRKADVIHISALSDQPSDIVESAIRRAQAEGIFVVAPVGMRAEPSNFVSDSDLVFQDSYPAAYENVIGVGAINERCELEDFSSVGPIVDLVGPGGTWMAPEVDSEGNLIERPPANVVDLAYGATPPDAGLLEYCQPQLDITNPGIVSTINASEYRRFERADIAAAHVSATIALMRAMIPDLEPSRFMNLLNNGDLTSRIAAEGVSDAQYRAIFGEGMISAEKSVNSLGNVVLGLLDFSPRSLSFVNGRSSGTVRLVPSDDSVRIESVDDNADWLSIANISGNEYEFVVDYSLVDGFDSADIIVRYSISSSGGGQVAEPTIVIPVFASTRIAQPGDLGNTFRIYLSKQEEITVGGETTSFFQRIDDVAGVFEDGAYNYSFGGLDPGNYLIEAGTDFDQDGDALEQGEAFGIFRLLPEPRTITILSEEQAREQFGSNYSPELRNATGQNFGVSYNSL